MLQSLKRALPFQINREVPVKEDKQTNLMHKTVQPELRLLHAENYRSGIQKLTRTYCDQTVCME